MSKFFIKLIIVTSLLYSLVIASAMYIYKNPKNFSGIMRAFPNVCVGLSIFGAYMGFMLNEESIKILIDELQSIVDNGKY